MYKYRIRQWGLDKKRKEPEMRALVLLHHLRALEGKKTVFEIRTESADLDDAREYFLRKGLSIDQVIAQELAIQQRFKAIPAVRCYTPPPPPSPLIRFNPMPELFFTRIREYLRGTYHSAFRCEKDGYWWNGKSGIQAGFCADIVMACAFFAKGLNYEAGLLLTRACSHISTIVNEECSWLFPHLFYLVFTTQAMCKPEIAQVTLLQFIRISEVKLEKQHPLHEVFNSLSWVASMPSSGLKQSAHKLLSDELRDLEGEWSTPFMISQNTYLELTMDTRKYIRKLQELAEEYEDTENSSADLIIMLHCEQARLFRNLELYKESQVAAEKAIEICEEKNCEGEFKCTQGSISNSKSHLAFAYYGLGNREKAEETLREGIELGAIGYGWEDARVINRLQTLREWLKEFGKFEDAEVTRRKISGIIGGIKFII